MDIIKIRNELANGKSIYDIKLRVVSYNRVSTDKKEQLNSLINQENYFNDMIFEIKNWNHIASYTDEGISGTQVYKRENFLKMIEDARLGKFDLIVTKEISRFARNTLDSIKYTQLLLNYGVIVYFISDNINTINPDSEFRLTLMASMAQDEVRKLSERVKFGIKRSIKAGKVGGSRLYGYIKKDCKLIIEENEAKAVKKLFSLYSSGNYGFRRIGKILAKDGHYTKKGKIFSDTTLKKMLTNPRYKGYYTANLSEVEDYKTHKKITKPKEEWIIYKDEKGTIPAIVSEEMWNKANNIYNKRNEKRNKNVLNKDFYLENKNYTSKIICAEHNKTFIRQASGKRKNNPVWQCNEYLRYGIKGCKTPILIEKNLNKLFTHIIEKIIDNKKNIINTITNDYINIIKENNNNKNTEILKSKIKEQEILKDRLLDMFLRKMLNDNDFIKKSKKLDEEIIILKKEIKSIKENKKTLGDKKVISKLHSELIHKLDINNNIGKYFNLFINKVLVSKINNDRKHLKLQIIFNFQKKDLLVEIKNSKTDSFNYIFL